MNDTLVVTTEFPDVAPEALFTYWTQPGSICRWWSQEAEIDLRVGGGYHLSWPEMNWHLRGHYTLIERGRQLAFTWRWDHDAPGTPGRTVVVAFEPLGATGTHLTVTHGSYANSEPDQAERAGHLEGWTFFLSRLRELTRGPDVAAIT